MLKKLFLIIVAVITLGAASQSSVAVAKAVNTQNQYNAAEPQIWSNRLITVAVDPNVPANVKRGVNYAMKQWNLCHVRQLVGTGDYQTADIQVVTAKLKDDKDPQAFTVYGRTTLTYGKKYIDHAKIMINTTAINHDDHSKGHQLLMDRTCLHEMGHALGLSHTTRNARSVMTPNAKYDLQPFDVQRLRTLYNGNY